MSPLRATACFSQAGGEDAIARALASGLARAAHATDAEAAALLDACEASFAALEARARAALAGSRVTRSTAAFHSALPDLAPFVLYRLPGLLLEAGACTPGDLRATAGAPAPWLAAQALRHLAIYAAAAQAADALEAGAIPPAQFPRVIAAAVRRFAAIVPEGPLTPCTGGTEA
ncbi:hypothetical protein [Tepidiforma sp.]|uniref:hypothetical protein n=1 Tax=Tepidiforma sp. TaxID=2682230 RepID=UPI002ADE7232|nr:hypothetical protein [Tepidiforma sp.]